MAKPFQDSIILFVSIVQGCRGAEDYRSLSNIYKPDNIGRLVDAASKYHSQPTPMYEP